MGNPAVVWVGGQTFEFDPVEAMYRIGKGDLENHPVAELVMATMICAVINAEDPTKAYVTYKKLGASDDRAESEAAEKIRPENMVKALKDMVAKGHIDRDGIKLSQDELVKIFSKED